MFFEFRNTAWSGHLDPRFFFISVGNPSGVKILVSFRLISCLGNGFCLPQTPSRMGLFQMEVFIIIIVTDGRMDVQEYVFILTGNVPLQKNLTFLFKKSKINKNIFSHKLGLGVLCRLFKFIFAKISKTHLYFFLIASRPLGKLVMTSHLNNSENITIFESQNFAQYDSEFFVIFQFILGISLFKNGPLIKLSPPPPREKFDFTKRFSRFFCLFSTFLLFKLLSCPMSCAFFEIK